jgi:hypothetical protein
MGYSPRERPSYLRLATGMLRTCFGDYSSISVNPAVRHSR